MKIRVIFQKDMYNNYNEDKLFVYKTKDNEVEVGDIVVVETRYGYGLAKVVETNTLDNAFAEEELKTVKCVVKSMAEVRQEQERKAQIRAAAAKVRKERLIKQIKELDVDLDDKFIYDMSEIELQEFLNIATGLDE